jgi:hypothetical protein
MSFALGAIIDKKARFSRVANISAILRADARQSLQGAPVLANADTFDAIRAKLARRG